VLKLSSAVPGESLITAALGKTKGVEVLKGGSAATDIIERSSDRGLDLLVREGEKTRNTFIT